MDKTRLYLREHTVYPGLVKPYADGDGHIDKSVFDSKVSTTRNHDSRIYHIPTSNNNRMNGLIRGKPKGCDPFSVYDDDRGEEHYFLVPRIKGDNIQVQEWRRTVKNSRSLRNISNFVSDKTNMEDRTCTYQSTLRQDSTNFTKKRQNSDSGEYCSLSATSKTSQNINSRQSLQQSLLSRQSFQAKDMESLHDFASKFTTTNDTCESQSSKTRSRIHSFDERKFDTWVELDGINGSDLGTKTKTRTKVDDCIDYCTCMTCVKGLCYHCTKDDEDGGVVDPCTCTGNNFGILKRWLCLGFLSCFMPCLFCYIPLKGCLHLCRRRLSDQYDIKADETVRVKYKKRERHKLKENTTLL